MNSIDEIRELLKRSSEEEKSFFQKYAKSKKSKINGSYPLYIQLYFKINEEPDFDDSQLQNASEKLREELERIISEVEFDKFQKDSLQIQMQKDILLIRNLLKKGLYKAVKRRLKNAIKDAIDNDLFNYYYELFQLKMDLYFIECNNIVDKPLHHAFLQSAKNIEYHLDEDIINALPFAIPEAFLKKLGRQIQGPIDKFFKEKSEQLNSNDFFLHLLYLHAKTIGDLERQEKFFDKSLSVFKDYKPLNFISSIELEKIVNEFRLTIAYQRIGNKDEANTRMDSLSSKLIYDKSKLYTALGYLFYCELSKVSDKPVDTELDLFFINQIDRMSLRVELNKLLLLFRASVGNDNKDNLSLCLTYIEDLTKDGVLKDEILKNDLKALKIFILMLLLNREAVLEYFYSEVMASFSVTQQDFFNRVKRWAENVNETINDCFRDILNDQFDSVVLKAIIYYLNESINGVTVKS